MVKILKVGGSILTDKSGYASPRPDLIRQMASQLKGFPGLILVHGAGSFGHAPARRYGLPGKVTHEGLLFTHQSVADLNRQILEALTMAGARPLPVHPLSCLVMRDGRIVRMMTEPLQEMVDRGFLPVLHGDVAMDQVCGAGIVSGDQLVTYLASAMCAELVALGTDVDGVLCQGQTIPVLERADLSGLDLWERSADVTGSMRGKIKELLDLADNGVNSRIFNAAVPGNIRRVLDGESLGTLIRGGRA
ncbi:MAG: Isopentenyl phosphate kinase [Methanosaeta sp. PtaB.Bin039]|nr:MAG: Isopentenyl phosphate kinase [Methanosaeta sp. PtaB.Bin039]OPY45598.1 MAG: Isopentenyl phosphate kinase [Methanosaeta sp. PtaU1.Bin028]HOT07261.1 isopentenyl phosphate kinase [Methanotrichaceae archaeon]HQF17289.1 isopentenyl phosphate kinase [Methanotrichaceae archaeon]HQI91862.1 isopentenyl phosphate kinase [Methanotrichaceae archaeon]